MRTVEEVNRDRLVEQVIVEARRHVELIERLVANLRDATEREDSGK